MRDKVLGFLASTSVSIVITAAGLAFDAEALTLFGCGLFAIVASAWLLLRFSPRPNAKDAEYLRDRRRQLISHTRSLISSHTEAPAGRDFRDWFEASAVFPEIRRYLSPEFMGKFDDRRTSMSSSGGMMDPFARMLANEMDRLERDWRLDRPA